MAIFYLHFYFCILKGLAKDTGALHIPVKCYTSELQAQLLDIYIVPWGKMSLKT